MASINYAAREISIKIVYYGPGLSGKTTNLQVIHRKTPATNRSDMVSLATETDRTLFFDFLPLDLGKIKGFSTKFQLYTVPGQVYYNATRKLVLRGVDGIVFVADSAPDKMQENIESFENLEENLAEYGYQRENIPIVLQWNKRDLPNAVPIEELNRILNKYSLPWNEAIASHGKGVFESLKMIGKIVLDFLNKKYSRQDTGAGAAQQVRRAPPPPPPPPAAPAPRQSWSPGPAFEPPVPPASRQSNDQFRAAPTPPAQQRPQYIPQPQFDADVQRPSRQFQPQQAPTAQQPAPAPNQGGEYMDYGNIKLSPMQDSSAPLPPPRKPAQAAGQQSRDTNLDWEIERYQQEISRKATGPKPAAHEEAEDFEVGGFQAPAPAGYQQAMPPQAGFRQAPQVQQAPRQQYPQQAYAAPRPEQQAMQPPSFGQGQQYRQPSAINEKDYNVYNMEPAPAQINPRPAAIPQGPNRLDDAGDDAMYFTSASPDRLRKVKKPVVNPKSKPPKGFFGKLFTRE